VPGPVILGFASRKLASGSTGAVCRRRKPRQHRGARRNSDSQILREQGEENKRLAQMSLWR
jgi:hypothetical protein